VQDLPVHRSCSATITGVAIPAPIATTLLASLAGALPLDFNAAGTAPYNNPLHRTLQHRAGTSLEYLAFALLVSLR
jgi:hypothetical protein